MTATDIAFDLDSLMARRSTHATEALTRDIAEARRFANKCGPVLRVIHELEVRLAAEAADTAAPEFSGDGKPTADDENSLLELIGRVRRDRSHNYADGNDLEVLCDQLELRLTQSAQQCPACDERRARRRQYEARYRRARPDLHKRKKDRYRAKQQKAAATNGAAAS